MLKSVFVTDIIRLSQIKIKHSLIKGNEFMKYSKLIAPIIITAILVLFLMGYCLIWFLIPEIPLFIRLILLAIFGGLTGLSIYNLYERIQEIRSGEEDDLSKY